MNSMIAPRTGLVGWGTKWLLWDYIQNDCVRGADGSGLNWDTEAEALGHMECIPQYADFSPQEIDPENTVPDIFTANIKVPGTVVIAGAGPSLSEGLDRVADGEYTIALNSAINYPFPYNLWIAFDHRVVDYPWWATMKLPKGCKVLFGSRLCNRLRRWPKEAKHRPDWYFSYMPPVDASCRKGDYLRDGLLRGGMNVLGAALQFCYWQGVNRVLLTGCDQFGCGHWDSFKNPDPYGSHKLHWNTIHRLSDLIDEMRAKSGMSVHSLTDTAIRGVERI